MRKASGARIVVVPESFFEALGVRFVKDFGPNAAEGFLYKIGRDAGKAYARSAEQDMGGPIGTEDGVRNLLRSFERYGWARIRLLALDLSSKFAVVDWRDGVGVPKAGSPLPVCHLGRGLLAGAAEVAFGTRCDAIETKCQATGADRCEIAVGIPERIVGVAERTE